MMSKIKEANPDFHEGRSSLKHVLAEVGDGANVNISRLQKALDKVEPAKAKRYAAALQILVNDYPQVCYTGLESFDHAETKLNVPTSCDLTNNNPASWFVRYTSVKFTQKATVYCICPQSTAHEIGFIQHCTAKNDQSNYSDKSAMIDACRVGFPVGDSAGPSHEPFYYKGISSECTQPAYVRLMGRPAGPLLLEVNDYFRNNGHFYHPRPKRTEVNQNATLVSIHRKQSFTLWLARVSAQTGTRLLRQCSFTINVKVEVKSPSVRSYSSYCSGITTQKTTWDSCLPMVTSSSMNDKSQWRYKAPRSSVFVPLV